jgi:hypothetical protein
MFAGRCPGPVSEVKSWVGYSNANWSDCIWCVGPAHKYLAWVRASAMSLAAPSLHASAQRNRRQSLNVSRHAVTAAINAPPSKTTAAAEKVPMVNRPRHVLCTGLPLLTLYRFILKFPHPRPCFEPLCAPLPLRH